MRVLPGSRDIREDGQRLGLGRISSSAGADSLRRGRAALATRGRAPPRDRVCASWPIFRWGSTAYGTVRLPDPPHPLLSIPPEEAPQEPPTTQQQCLKGWRHNQPLPSVRLQDGTGGAMTWDHHHRFVEPGPKGGEVGPIWASRRPLDRGSNEVERKCGVGGRRHVTDGTVVETLRGAIT